MQAIGLDGWLLHTRILSCGGYAFFQVKETSFRLVGDVTHKLSLTFTFTFTFWVDYVQR